MTILALLLGVLLAAPVAADQLILEWTDNSANEDGFIIERAKAPCTPVPTFTIFALVIGNVTTYTDTTLAPGELASYRVKAFNTAGESDYTNCAEGLAQAPPPPPPPPPAPTVSVVPTSVLATLPLMATVMDAPGTPTDWVGIFAAGAASSAATLLDWVYTCSGTRTACTLGKTAATVPLTAPAVAGAYEARLFSNNAYTPLRASAPLTVTPAAPPPPPPVPLCDSVARLRAFLLWDEPVASGGLGRAGAAPCRLK